MIGTWRYGIFYNNALGQNDEIVSAQNGWSQVMALPLTWGLMNARHEATRKAIPTGDDSIMNACVGGYWSLKGADSYRTAEK